MDLTTLRTEIKAWERDFNDRHNRTATVRDIKAHPDIAEKYKLYRRLSKADITSSVILSTSPSSSKSLLRKSRPSAAPPPTDTANPFSPTKKRIRSSPAFSTQSSGERDVKSQSLFTLPSARPNRSAAMDTLCEDPFPLIEVQLADHPGGAVDSHLKKARKRLHGDPVTPTPQKNIKRRRTSSPPASPTDAIFNPDKNHGDTQNHALDESYVEDSPIKQSVSGKNFRPLFEDAPPKLHLPGLRNETRVKEACRVFSSRNDAAARMHAPLLNTAPPRHSRPNEREETEGMSEMTDTLKRRLSLDGLSPHDKAERTTQRIVSDLLPPSPTIAAVPLPKARAKLHGLHVDQKSSSIGKKMKLGQDTSETQSTDEVEDESLEVLEVNPLLTRRIGLSHADQFSSTRGYAQEQEDEDVLDFSVADLRSAVPESTTIGEDNEGGEELEVDLPDDLRNMLHITPSRARERDERLIVQTVLNGEGRDVRRGEIWAAGEIEEDASFDTDGEEEWAEEGVPWEVGEL